MPEGLASLPLYSVQSITVLFVDLDYILHANAKDTRRTSFRAKLLNNTSIEVESALHPSS